MSFDRWFNKLTSSAPAEKRAYSQDSRDAAIAGGVGLGTGAALATAKPQELAQRGAVSAFKSIDSGYDTLTDADLERLSKEYGVDIKRGLAAKGKEKSIRAQAGKKGVTVGPKASEATLRHEMGHLADKGRVAIPVEAGLSRTGAKLRNEAMANINAVRAGGMGQIPHAASAMSTYVAGAARRHPLVAAGLAAPVAAAGTYGALQKTSESRRKTKKDVRKALRQFSREQGIDPNKAMLVAGGAMYMHGLRDDINDIDFFHPDLKGFVKKQQGRFEMDGGPARDLPPEAKKSQRIGGLNVQTPEAMLAFYKRLNRPKDQTKIELLQKRAFHQELEKLAAYSLRKGLRAEAKVIKDALKEVLTSPPTKEHLKAYSRHSALNAGLAARQVRYPLHYTRAGKRESAKRRLVDLINAAAFTAMPPTHHKPGELAQMAKGVGKHRDWFKQGYKPWKYPDPEKVKTAEQDGHWRRLKPGQKGHGRGGELQIGRTWVSQNRMRKGMKPLPHQADFSKAVKHQIGGKKGGGIIAAHGTGTGKTFGSINAFEELKGEGKARRALVIAPAGLRQNYLKKGVEKFTTSKGVILTKPSQVSKDTEYVVVSYAAFRQNPDAWIKQVNPDMIIADEVHRAGNPEGMTHRALRYARSKVPRFMGLTASISQNDPSDIIPLLDIAQAGQQPIKSKKTFRRAHIKKVPAQQRGIFGGRTFQKRLVDHSRLTKGVGSSVHYVEDLDAKSKPIKDAETVEVRMSREQGRKYQLAMKGMDPSLQRKIRLGEALRGKERANAFTRLLRARQASNSLHLSDPTISLEESAVRTPKMKKVLDDVSTHIKDTPDAQVIMYTNYVRGGVDVLSAGLKAKGIPFGVFAGKGVQGVTEASRQKAVTDYQAGKNKVILITGAGAEGLSLGNTTMVQVVDGHYNPERMAQAEARGIRAGGLSHRKPENRRVKVKRYVSTLPKTFWQSVTFQKPGKSVGQWVYATAGGKEDLNKDLRKVLAKRSEHERKRRESRMYRTFGGNP